MTKISFDVDFNQDPQKILEEIQKRAEAEVAKRESKEKESSYLSKLHEVVNKEIGTDFKNVNALIRALTKYATPGVRDKILNTSPSGRRKTVSMNKAIFDQIKSLLSQPSPNKAAIARETGVSVVQVRKVAEGGYDKKFGSSVANKEDSSEKTFSPSLPPISEESALPPTLDTEETEPVEPPTPLPTVPESTDENSDSDSSDSSTESLPSPPSLGEDLPPPSEPETTEETSSDVPELPQSLEQNDLPPPPSLGDDLPPPPSLGDDLPPPPAPVTTEEASSEIPELPQALEQDAPPPPEELPPPPPPAMEESSLDLPPPSPPSIEQESELPSPSFGDESGVDDLSVPPPPSLLEEPAENQPNETSSQDLAPLPPSPAEDLPPSPPAPEEAPVPSPVELPPNKPALSNPPKPSLSSKPGKLSLSLKKGKSKTKGLKLTRPPLKKNPPSAD